MDPCYWFDRICSGSGQQEGRGCRWNGEGGEPRSFDEATAPLATHWEMRASPGWSGWVDVVSQTSRCPSPQSLSLLFARLRGPAMAPPKAGPSLQRPGGSGAAALAPPAAGGEGGDGPAQQGRSRRPPSGAQCGSGGDSEAMEAFCGSRFWVSSAAAPGRKRVGEGGAEGPGEAGPCPVLLADSPVREPCAGCGGPEGPGCIFRRLPSPGRSWGRAGGVCLRFSIPRPGRGPQDPMPRTELGWLFQS